MHRFDAKMRGIGDGEMVAIWTRRGEVQCQGVVSKQVKDACIWMPLHFAEARANLLTNDVGDASTGTAEFKVCAAQGARVDGQGSSPSKFPGSFYRG